MPLLTWFLACLAALARCRSIAASHNQQARGSSSIHPSRSQARRSLAGSGAIRSHLPYSSRRLDLNEYDDPPMDHDPGHIPCMNLDQLREAVQEATWNVTVNGTHRSGVFLTSCDHKVSQGGSPLRLLRNRGGVYTNTFTYRM